MRSYQYAVPQWHHQRRLPALDSCRSTALVSNVKGMGPKAAWSKACTDPNSSRAADNPVTSLHGLETWCALEADPDSIHLADPAEKACIAEAYQSISHSWSSGWSTFTQRQKSQVHSRVVFIRNCRTVADSNTALKTPTKRVDRVGS